MKTREQKLEAIYVKIECVEDKIYIGDMFYFVEKIKNDWEKCKDCWDTLEYDECNVWCPNTWWDKYVGSYYCSKCEYDSRYDEDFENGDRVYCIKNDLIFWDFQDNWPIWKEFNKPITEQSDKCVDYVYNLLPKQNTND